MMSFYIYKYTYENEIVYIGKTINLSQRIKEHSREKKFQNEKFDIYYFLCSNQRQMDFYEYVLINKYKPALNVMNKKEFEEFSFIEPTWIKYDKNTVLITKEIEENDLNNFLSVSEASKYANVSKQALYQQKDNGTLDIYLFNGKIYFKKEDIDRKYKKLNNCPKVNNYDSNNELKLLINLAKKYNAKLIFE